MAFLDKAEDYEALGVKPPEVIEHGTVEEINSKTDDHFHRWHQKGIEIYCEEGEYRHGRHVPPDHILVGTDSITGIPLYNIVDNSAFSIKTSNS